MKYITILDAQFGHVYQYELDEENESIECFIKSIGFKIENIKYMVHFDKTIYYSDGGYYERDYKNNINK